MTKKLETNKSKKIRKGDTVVAIAGNDRGQTGSVLAVVGEKAVVQGLNVRKKHVKPTQQNQRGGIVELEKPIHISNLKLCDKDGKPMKVKVRTEKSGERKLVYSVDGKQVVHRTVKKS